MTMRRVLGLGLVTVALLAGCGGDDDDNGGGPTNAFPADQAQKVVATYKLMTHAVYEDSVAGAKSLQAAIDTLVATPTAENLKAAQDAWVAARVPYNQNDAFRFYNGPIDNDPNGPEGSINSWPLDESHIDYTRDVAATGIVNDPTGFASITTDVIDGQNGKEGETEVTTGYHAIEFLLWGQDDKVVGTGAGKRPFTDYVTGATGTAANQDRRGTYLKVAADLLVADLTEVEEAWEPGKTDNYAASFGVTPEAGSSTNDGLKDAIANMIRGMGSLAKAELSGERMTVAFKSRDQEDEHSCFSDNTWHDLYGNGLGIQNVWLGQYKGASLGPGVDTVVRAVDGALADQITADIKIAVDGLKAFSDGNATVPFDVVIAEADNSEHRTQMVTIIQALKRAADGMAQGAAKLGLTIELEAPSQDL